MTADRQTLAAVAAATVPATPLPRGLAAPVPGHGQPLGLDGSVVCTGQPESVAEPDASSLYVATRPDGTLFHASRPFEPGAVVEFVEPPAELTPRTKIFASTSPAKAVDGYRWPWRLWQVHASTSGALELTAGVYALRRLTVHGEAAGHAAFGPNGEQVWLVCEALTALRLTDTDLDAALAYAAHDTETHRRRQDLIDRAGRAAGHERQAASPLVLATVTLGHLVADAADDDVCDPSGSGRVYGAWWDAVVWAGKALVVRDHLSAGDYRDLVGPFRRLFPGLARLVD